MSTGAVIDFINRSDSDHDLRRDLRDASGVEGVILLAGERGYDFTPHELGRVTSLLMFVRDLWTVPELRAAVKGAPDDVAVVRIAAEHGYVFTAEDLEVVVLSEEDELAEAELAAVAGGTSSPVDGRGLRVMIHSPTKRTTAKNSFGDIAKRASGKGGVAAPFVPGSSVLSAAMSG